MLALLPLLVVSAAPFQPSDIDAVKPAGTADRVVLKGKAPWCQGPFLGEAGWDTGRIRRTVNSVNGRGSGRNVVGAIQLCELPDDPTWQKAAQHLLQAWVNECGCSQADAEAEVGKAIERWKKEKDNEGKEPTDEEKFAFGDDDFNVEKPEPGVEAVKAGPLAWCEGVTLGNADRWDARRIARTVGGKYGIDGTIDGALHLCWRKDDPTWQQEAAYVLQKWMNWTRQSKAEAERSLKARVQTATFNEQRVSLCKALEFSPELTGAERAFAEAQLAFFACSTRDHQPLWQEGFVVDNVGFSFDPLGDPPNEVVRLVHLFNSIDDPFRNSEPLPSKDAMRNASLLEFAVAQSDLLAFNQSALDKQLSAEPYNEYARVVASELVARLKGIQKVYEAAIEKMTKGDADYAAILKAAPKQGAADWARLSKDWSAELGRSNAFELKLGQPSRKALKGCGAELRPDFEKVLKRYKLTDFNAIVARLSTDPIAILLMSRLAVCSSFEKVTGLSGVLADLVKKGRDLRGPRSMAYYAVVDALAEALKDRPKMVFSLESFGWRGSSLTEMVGSEFSYSGSIPYDLERTDAKGVVASTAKVAEGVEIKFKHTSYTYPEAICVDDKFHPLRIESNGSITYAQNCKYTGKTVTVDTTPRPIVVATELATNVKAGVFAVGQEYGERSKGGAFLGTVHFTKKGPSDKAIQTFYGFDL